MKLVPTRYQILLNELIKISKINGSYKCCFAFLPKELSNGSIVWFEKYYVIFETRRKMLLDSAHGKKEYKLTQPEFQKAMDILSNHQETEYYVSGLLEMVVNCNEFKLSDLPDGLADMASQYIEHQTHGRDHPYMTKVRGKLGNDVWDYLEQIGKYG